MEIHVIEGRNSVEPIADVEMLLIMERLKARFITNLRQRVRYADGWPVTVSFGFVFRDGKEVFFAIGNEITSSAAEINWKTTKTSNFALHMEVVTDGDVCCDVYFGKIFDVDEYDSLENMKRIIDSAGIEGLKYSLN
ncbi:hypothetical protein J6S46_01170 [Candidatus Saccharibacteria bacterium]|nr:hypothetical protein [Candidatus Saccharibacteria bacterium]